MEGVLVKVTGKVLSVLYFDAASPELATMFEEPEFAFEPGSRLRTAQGQDSVLAAAILDTKFLLAFF